MEIPVAHILAKGCINTENCFNSRISIVVHALIFAYIPSNRIAPLAQVLVFLPVIVFFFNMARLAGKSHPLDQFGSIPAIAIILSALAYAWATASAQWQARNLATDEPVALVHIDTSGRNMSFWALRPRMADRPHNQLVRTNVFRKTTSFH